MKIRYLFLCVLALLASFASAIQVAAGPYKLDVSTDPAVIPVGRANLIIKVTDSAGKPVGDAKVRAIAKMPGMTMGEREEAGTPSSEAGTYVVPATFSMAGAYEATITVEGPAGQGTAKVPLQTGANSEASSQPWLLYIVGVAILGYVLYRVRRTGQKVDAKQMLRPGVVGSVLLLAASILVARWAVQTQRRDGAMTPIESQAMEMNTPAPEGTIAVELAAAKMRPVGETVTYTGQAVGFVEQQVVPRVTGTIVEMPVYVGSKVKKGDLLVRLDTSEIAPEVAMRRAAADRAAQGVGVATLEFQAAQQAVTQARAEARMADGAAAEARAMLEAKLQERATAASELASAEAEAAASQAGIDRAKADRDYMVAELERSKALLDKNAISRDEFQRAQADASKAEAMLREAQQGVRKAQAAVQAARAGQRRAEAEIDAARRSVQQANANIAARNAMVQTALADAAAAKAKIDQERAMSRETDAALTGATTRQGYAEIRSTVDGVVTERVVSPGVLASPGVTVLKVAQTTPIRLQANVPEQDLARIRVGSPVLVQARNQKVWTEAKVTSVAPSVGSESRLGMVEAVIPNEEGKFVPGQFISMRMAVGAENMALAVPSSAVVYPPAVNAESAKAVVWLAEPGMNGEYTVIRTEVEVGESGDGFTAIRSGIKEGQMVVNAPGPDLRTGFRVTDAAAAIAEAKDEPMTILVTERGFEPSTVAVPKDKPIELIFQRIAKDSCGTEVVFPDLKITKPLPLNEKVLVQLPAQPARELRFACGMDMLKGKVVVK